MRLYSFVAAAALLTASIAAHADSITQQLTVVNGTAVQRNGGFYQVDTDSFLQFNPALGTLTSVVASFQGTATTAAFNDGFAGVYYSGNFGLNGETVNGYVVNPGTFSFSEALNDSSVGDLALFTGTTLNPFGVAFSKPTADVTLAGSITYNYTAAVVSPVAVTPEPSSLALLGTGILGVVGVLRKRLA